MFFCFFFENIMLDLASRPPFQKFYTSHRSKQASGVNVDKEMQEQEPHLQQRCISARPCLVCCFGARVAAPFFSNFLLDSYLHAETAKLT